MIAEGKTLPDAGYDLETSQVYDERFSTPQGRMFDAVEWEELTRAIEMVPPGASALEVGCGTGRFSKRLAERGFHVRAIDPSRHMIELAMGKCRGIGNITFAREEGGAISSGDCAFDFTFAIRVLNNTGTVKYALKTMEEMIRVTKPGGLILVEFMNGRRPFRRKSKYVLLSFSEISEAARKQGCHVASRRGIMVLSQPFLDITPAPLLPLWRALERSAEVFLWRWASRGYILLRKQTS